jgi:drug/metabolite transporter (DMT)-like permease
VQLLIAKIKVTQVHPTIMVFYRNGIAAVLMGAWMILTGKAELHVDWSYWLATILGAFIGPCAGFILTFRSYHYWELSRASMVMTMQPLFVLPLAYLFLDKLPDPKELLGGSIILVGAFWLAYIHLRKKNKGHIAASG